MTSGSQVIVSLSRLNRIREIDALNYSITAEAGCLLVEVQRAAADVERFFPLSLGSEGSCQIGGNLSTNAGGTSVLRYGMMRDLVLGLEVVLADGRILNTLTRLRKDNTGYDVKSLFLGAEGTLGIITAATLKLYPAIRSIATAFVAVASVQAAVELLSRLRKHSGDRVSSFELIPRLAVDLTVQHVRPAVDPAARAARLVRAVRTDLAARRGAARDGAGGGARRRAWRGTGAAMPPLPKVAVRPRTSGSSARTSRARSAWMAPASSMTFRCRWRCCRSS